MLSNRAANITPSITLGISAKVKELKNKGVAIIDLSIGEPDFLTPDKVKEEGKAAIDKNLTKYDAASGNIVLRQAICEKLKKENALDYQADQIVVSSGAKHAITNALLATINPGDEVLIPVPYWVSYPEMVSLCGGVPVLVQTKKEAGFKVTLEDITPHLSDRTKMIILTNPSNPTGNVFSKKELQSLCGALVEKNILILADEIYERVIYDEPFTSIASLSEEIYDKTILINGLSKSASMTGWRLGYSATNKKLAKAMGSIQSHLTSHPSTITQAAAIVALRACDDEINHMIHTYKERRDYIENFFKQWGKLDIIPPKGAFYVFIDISPLRAKLKDESLSLKVCEDMIEKYKVAFIPGIGFGQDDFIRLSYAAAMEDIKEGLVRFKTYVDQVLED